MRDYTATNLHFASVLTMFTLFLAGLMISGCTTKTAPRTAALPALTFAHLDPVPVDVTEIDIENLYNPASNPDDVSETFPTPPDIALRRYAEQRLTVSEKMPGTLKFVIEDARVHHNFIKPENGIVRWTGFADKDRYEVVMKIRLYTVMPSGQDSPHSILNMRKAITIPQSYSLAEKEEAQFEFLRSMMDDVDKAVISTLSEKMDIVSTPVNSAPAVFETTVQ